MAPDADVEVFSADGVVVAVDPLREEELGDSDSRWERWLVVDLWWRALLWDAEACCRRSKVQKRVNLWFGI